MHLFTEASRVGAALRQIRRTADDERFTLLAYCFMTDHLHLLVEGTHHSSDLRRFAKIAKQRVAYSFRIEFGVARVWQEGYDERVLRSDEATEVVIRYILENPVKARIVSRAEDYPYSGALSWPTHF
jgi:putative transposase